MQLYGVHKYICTNNIWKKTYCVHTIPITNPKNTTNNSLKQATERTKIEKELWKEGKKIRIIQYLHYSYSMNSEFDSAENVYNYSSNVILI